MKKILISFASEDKKYGNRFYRSQNILLQSAKKFFTGYIAYNPSLLDANFVQQNNKIFNQDRGFGYWLWKPYIINRVLTLVNDGDIIFYVDSGNSFVNTPEPLFNILNKDNNGIILFNNHDGAPPGTVWKNIEWTKYDCFKKMNCLDERYINGDQVNGSYILLKKNKFSVSFFKEYLEFCQDEDILTDKLSTTGKEFPEYKTHRHDQSVLSLLSIKHNITILRDPSEWGNNYITPKCHHPQIFYHHRGFI
jgi:hypothetical protein